MSTASNSTPSTENRNGQYAKFDEYVDYQVSRTGSHIKANDLLTTAVGISTIFLGYLLIFILCDHWLIKGGFGHLSRLLMLAGVILASIGWAVWKLVVPYFKKVTRLYSAHALEQTSEEMQGALLNLVDLQRSERKVNPEIISSLEKRAALTLSQTDTDHAVDRRPLMRLSYCLLFVVAILCFYALFSPKQIWPSLSAAISFSSDREFATQTQIGSVTPGNAEVLAGSQLEVVVDLRGEVPENVTLYYTSSDQGRVNEPIKLRPLDETLKRFQGLLIGVNGRGIRQDLTYHIEAGDAVSAEYQVSVIQPPSATVHSVRYEYPAYMELAAVEQPGGAIDAYEGTQVTVDATTNMPITSFEVLFSDEEDAASPLEEFQLKKNIEKNTITASWKLKLRADGTFPKFYQIKCRNEAGQTTLSPTVYPLMIRPDLPPEISLLSPKQDLKLPANGTVPISVIAEDPDFKIRYLNLRVEKQQIRILDKTLFEGDRKSVGINYDLALEPLRLTPGDTIFFWVESRDNKHPSGNRKNTPKIKIEILEPVSPEEAKKQLEEQKQKAAEQNQQPNPDQQKQPGQKEGQEKQPGQQPGEQQMPDQKQGDSKSETGKQPGDQKQPGNEDQKQSDQPGQKKSDSPEPGAEPKQEPGDGQKQSQQEKQEGLDSDGSDDQEALKKILDKLKKEGEEPQPDQKDQEQKDQEQKGQGKENQGSEKQNSDQPGSEKKMQEPESNGSDSKSQQSSPSQDKNSEGTPGKGQNQNQDQKPKPSSKANENSPDQKSSGQKQEPQKGKVENGKQEPSDSESADRKMKSKGDPNGKAKPDHDPNAKPERSSNDLKRDPKEKPAMRPGDKKSPDGDPQQKPENSSAKPGQPDNQTEQKPGSEMRKPEQKNDNPSPAKQQQAADAKKSPQKQDQPDGSNQPPGGKPEPKDQKSKRPQDGENGNSSQNDQGQKGSQQPGKGDSTGKKGNQEQGSQGKPSGSQKPMNQNQPQNKQGQDNQKQNQQDQKQQENKQSGNNQKGNQNQQGQKSGGQKGDKSGGKQGGKQGGQGSSQGKGKSQKGNSQAPGSSKGGSSDDPQGSSATTGGSSTGDGDAGNAGASPSLPDADEANLEYGKEAANLVLKRIKDELKRDKVDPELLKELGWTKDEMKQFSERLQKQLQTPDQNQQTPESLARKRQFEEMLKSLKPAGQAARRNRNSTRQQNSDSLGPRRLPVPEEYREAYDAFTRGLANQKPADK
ncbi:hypothetical protein [Gimesia panareensis]|uniref:hypothetical protein n=1 Tax=Gimesia panareensis TaxID=2527978 RepID=UPI00118BE1F2|nr:hypothetical protein [Gimesia panareensis]QDU50071.1 hypothetical protein Pan110_24130 [Gimesia panareensis]